MKATFITIELLESTLDFLYDLRGEWDWKKNEPRAGNQKQFDLLCENIKNLEEIRDYIRSQRDL